MSVHGQVKLDFSWNEAIQNFFNLPGIDKKSPLW